MINEETIEVEEKDEGFTLVELLIVIVILGILATIVVFAVRGITDQGQTSACKATAKTYEVAIEAYYANYGNAVNPSGDQLKNANLIRSYDATGDIRVDPSTTPSSITKFGKCSSVTL
jgi:general secretion pathway protein G